MSRKVPCKHRPASDRGSMVVAAAMWLLVVAVLALGLGRVGTAAISASRAASGADAVALAGAAADDAAAERAAGRNGVVILSRQRIGDSFQVEVSFGPARAVARAIRLRIP